MKTFVIAVIAAWAVLSSPAVAQSHFRSHLREQFSGEDRAVLDALTTRVRRTLPPRARIPGDVRIRIARAMPGLSHDEVEALTAYVSLSFREDAGPLFGKAGGIGGTSSSGAGSNSAIGSAAGGDSQGALLNATKQMQETQMSFNMQYLQLQSQMQAENRSFTAVSNIMKTKHDTVKNAISNIRQAAARMTRMC